MVSPRSRHAVLCAVLAVGLHGMVAVAEPARDAVPLSEDYVLKVWEMDDGLPNNTVTGITQTPDGYLWLATNAGLSRFDGVRFTVFPRTSSPEFSTSMPYKLRCSREGDLWIGLIRGGVVRLREGRFETIVPSSPREGRANLVTSFAEDAAGAMWIGLAPEQKALRWENGLLTTFTAEHGIGPDADTQVRADRDGRIWFATKGGCGTFDGERFQPVDANGGTRVQLTRARAGGMWAARGKHLIHYGADNTPVIVGELPWPKGAVEVVMLFEDDTQNVWLGTRGSGLFRFTSGRFLHVPTSHQAISAISQDREHNLWVGTRGGGLNRLRPGRFVLREAKDGLGTDSVVSLCEDADKTLWIGLRESPPVRATSLGNKTFAQAEGWTGGLVTSVCADPSKGIWIGTDGARVIRWRDGVFTKLDLHARSGQVLADTHGDVWMAILTDQLLRWHDSDAPSGAVDEKLPRVRALAEDGRGHIWAGTDDGGLYRREGEHFMPVPMPGAKPRQSIRFIVPDGPDTVWVGASGGGLARWRTGHMSRLTADAGLPTNDLRSLVLDEDGNLWLTAGTALIRAERQGTENALDGKEGRVPMVMFGREDGLRNVGFAYGRRNAAIRTHDGHLWFATDRGALDVNPHVVRRTEPLPPILIEGMQINGRSVAWNTVPPLVLPPKPAPVEFHYTVPTFRSADKLRFRHRLIGIDDGWTEVQDQRIATYPRLPPGEYRFEVAVSEPGGTWQTALVAPVFTVSAAWWETWWFRALSRLIAAVVLAWLVRLIVKRRMRARMMAMEQQHALERERARIARDMHDELGSSLTRIALMSELASDEPEMAGQAGERLGEIARMARAVSGSLDEIVWTVNPRNDTLERLIGYIAESGREHLELANVEVHLDLPENIPALAVPSDTRHQLLLAVKEVVNNVVKHAAARTATLCLEFQNGVLKITIRDDGRGFDPATIADSSNGLINMQHRLEALRGSVQITSRLGNGCIVTFTVPMAGTNP
ncbi:MAG: ATP-binding protein [Prosthecobacter sp.]|uniref:sensor histidine kinase n=1 Tax=Prosthecobacter sp. TaxID=1965333 RepID=UPI0025ED1FA1|nr:sensor histidine kinase [Prosthecobacter sp.]MCF7786528.1 ATP-binding protein [Prosthecobacter sp.]